MNRVFNRVRAPVKRQSAEQYLLIALLSFAASVSLTRLFLELAGYPQLGNSELHIAHVLWGGLLLFAGALFPLIFANRWAYNVCALLAGVGVGLFIDEVGKFITQSNDYFYPAAAPIVYAFFLITVLVYVQVRRRPSHDARANLYRVLEGLQEVLDRDLDPQEQADLEKQLHRIAAEADHPDLSHLARELLDFMKSSSLTLSPDRPSIIERIESQLAALEKRFIDRRRLRFGLAIGLGGMGVVAFVKGVDLLFIALGPDPAEHALTAMAALGPVTSASSIPWFYARLVLEGFVGALLLSSGVALLIKKERFALAAGYYGLLISLAVVNLLVFYFDQFSTVIIAAIQFVILLGMVYYRRTTKDTR
jgi:hypothetical protein